MASRWDVREPRGAELPRERLLRSGVESLSDAELVAIVLRTGARGVSALSLARCLLAEHGGLSALVGVHPGEIDARGIGPAKRATLAASVEIGCRIAREEIDRGPILGRPAAVARYLRLRYRRPGQEVLGAVYLDARQRPIRDEEIYRGSLDRSTAEPRAILKRALLLDAKSLIVFHTHPSGDPTPSLEDLRFTRALRDAGRAVSIALADHLIVGDGGRWVSLRERGDW